MLVSEESGSKGALHFVGKHSTVRIARPASGVVHVLLTGTDIGEHGEGPFLELTGDSERGPLDIFIDARASLGISINVSRAWTKWFTKYRSRLRSVVLLAGSRFIQVTAKFVRTPSGLEIDVLMDRAQFDQRLERAVTEMSGG